MRTLVLVILFGAMLAAANQPETLYAYWHNLTATQPHDWT